jgi:hydroxymethylglutaryl-CoA reductase
MPEEINYAELAKAAALLTDAQFKNKVSLVQFADSDLEDIIMETGISKKDLETILAEVKSATATNESTANTIKNINNGVSAFLAIAAKAATFI